jgi:hypothetical protein
MTGRLEGKVAFVTYAKFGLTSVYSLFKNPPATSDPLQDKASCGIFCGRRDLCRADPSAARSD